MTSNLSCSKRADIFVATATTIATATILLFNGAFFQLICCCDCLVNCFLFNCRFVGLTIQKTGLLTLLSTVDKEADKWLLEVNKGTGLGFRGGVLTVEGGGRLEARNLDLRAYKCEVDLDGWINLDRKGFVRGKDKISMFEYEKMLRAVYWFSKH